MSEQESERPVSSVTRTLESFALAFVVAGFPIIAGISEFLEVASAPLSIGMRAMTALLCGFIVVFSRQIIRANLWWPIIIITGLFWIGYLLRMTNDTFYASFALLYEPSSYWIWAIGGCLIPLFGLARAGFTLSDAPAHFRLCLLFSAVAALIALPSLSTVVTSEYGDYDAGRAALTALNPISLGHLGVQLAILCLWAVLLGTGRVRPIWLLIYAALAVLGLYLALVANSRGPLVALLGVVIFGAAASRQSGKYILLGMFVVIALTFAPLLAVVDQIAGTSVYDRLLGQSQFQEENVIARVQLYDSAWNQFLRSPLVGSGLEDPSFGGYPHNLFIEAFMATGVLGGLLMLILILLVFICAFRVVRDCPAYGWLALLTVQQVIAMQFSGTIGQATAMWGLIGAMLAISTIGVVSSRSPMPKRPPREGSFITA